MMKAIVSFQLPDGQITSGQQGKGGADTQEHATAWPHANFPK